VGNEEGRVQVEAQGQVETEGEGEGETEPDGKVEGEVEGRSGGRGQVMDFSSSGVTLFRHSKIHIKKPSNMAPCE